MSFASETAVKAVRKRHRCDGCGDHIEVGERAIRWVGMTDGDFGSAIYHPDCRAAELALNTDILGYQDGDDWSPLSDIEFEDVAWLKEAFPSVAERMWPTPHGVGLGPTSTTRSTPEEKVEQPQPLQQGGANG